SHPDVEVFAVDAGPHQQDADVGGGTLGAVDRASPAVVDVVGEIRGWQQGSAAATQVVDKQPAVDRGGEDAVAVAVAHVAFADLNAAVVAAGEQQVACLPASAAAA